MSDACGCGRRTRRRGRAGTRALVAGAELQAAAAAAVFVFAGYSVGWSGGPHPLAVVLQWVALLIGAFTFVPSTLQRLVRGKIGVGTLMTIAAVGAVILGEVGEAAMLAVLFSISEGLEEYALCRTPPRPAGAAVPGPRHRHRAPRRQPGHRGPGRAGDRDLMRVKPGERIATDGIITHGRTAVDVSAITGESVPVEAGPGDEVFAGSINGTGALTVEVTTTAADNPLAKIVQIVEAEQSGKGNAQRLADRIASPLVPAIMIAAAAIAVLGSCSGTPPPGLNVPWSCWLRPPHVRWQSRTGHRGRGDRRRQQDRSTDQGGAALEALGRVRTVALDKTGTLTANRPTVVDIATTTSPDGRIAGGPG